MSVDGPSTGLLYILAQSPPAGIPWADATGPLLVVGVCLLLAALFSGAEAGFLALSRLHLHELKETGHPRAPLLMRIMEKPAELVSAMLIANTTINVLTAIMWTRAIDVLFAPLLVSAGSVTEIVRLILEVIVLTLIVVIFTEITPKAWAHQRPVLFCTTFAPLIAPALSLTRPAVVAFQFVAQGLLRLIGVKIEPQKGVTEEELIQYLAAGEESGVLHEDERELIHSILEFGDLEVQQVMVPRVEMVTVEQDATLTEAMRAAMESGHSRLPVHDGDRDHIEGHVHAKDLLRALVDPETAAEVTIRDSGLLRPMSVVHETKAIRDLFNEMKAQKIHLVLVVDEYGGTAGLVTIEDLLEQLVGEIVDESDIQEPPFRFDRTGALIVDGHLALHELADLILWDIPENGVETVGGLVYTALGRVPQSGEVVDLGGLQVRVLELEDNRIKELKLIDAELTDEAREILIRQRPETLLAPRPTPVHEEYPTL